MPGEEVIRLSSWSRDAEEYILEPADLGQVRSAAEPPGKALSPECEPRVALPASAFDFVALEAIRDHPAIHPLVRAELDLGVPFRVLRFPLALHSPERCRIAEAIYTVSLRSGGRRVPRVHSIFPERIEVHQEISAEISIEPTLKLGGALEIGAGRIGRKIIAQQARSTIVGYWSEAGAEWSIRAPNSDEGLEGTWDFLVVVRWERAVTPLRVSLSLSATITTPRPILSWRTRRIERIYEAVRVTGCTPIA